MIITCGDIYECNYARPRSALCGAVRRCAGYDKTKIEGIYVAIKIKNPPLLWCKQSDIYEVFHGKYMVFNH